MHISMRRAFILLLFILLLGGCMGPTTFTVAFESNGGTPVTAVTVGAGTIVDLPAETFVAVATSGYHAAALTSSGRLFLWGGNGDGQLGNGSTALSVDSPVEITPRFDLEDGEVLVKVELGGAHSAALTSRGRLFVWGANWFGQLGNGTYDNQVTPQDITGFLGLAEGEAIASVALGSGHDAATESSLGRTSEGRVFLWGNNALGQLGRATADVWSGPVSLSAVKPELDQIVRVAFDAPIPDYAPTREGYTLSAWFQDADFTTAATLRTMPDADVVVYAFWIKD